MHGGCATRLQDVLRCILGLRSARCRTLWRIEAPSALCYSSTARHFIMLRCGSFVCHILVPYFGNFVCHIIDPYYGSFVCHIIVLYYGNFVCHTIIPYYGNTLGSRFALPSYFNLHSLKYGPPLRHITELHRDSIAWGKHWKLNRATAPGTRHKPAKLKSHSRT